MEEKKYLEGKKVLLVDDEVDILASLEELLPMCDLVKASTFEQAKEIIETQYFDIAILDIMGINGYKLLDITTEFNVLTVMLTANALSPDDTIRSFKGGAVSFIPKEKMYEITVYLNDILEAKEKGESPLWRWLDRFSNYYAKKFTPAWKDSDKEFWKDFPHYI